MFREKSYLKAWRDLGHSNIIIKFTLVQNDELCIDKRRVREHIGRYCKNLGKREWWSIPG